MRRKNDKFTGKKIDYARNIDISDRKVLEENDH